MYHFDRHIFAAVVCFVTNKCDLFGMFTFEYKYIYAWVWNDDAFDGADCGASNCVWWCDIFRTSRVLTSFTSKSVKTFNCHS